jgi:hypothetical protein
VLIMRVPTRPLRWALIGVLVAINMAQYHGRLTASEPPTDRFAASVVRSHAPHSTFRAYTRLHAFGLHGPAGGVTGSGAARYYLTVLGERPTSPQAFRHWNPVDGPTFAMHDAPSRQRRALVGFVGRDVRRAGHLTEIEIWETLRPGEVDLTDPVLEQLGETWKRTHEERFRVRDHWTWMHYYDVRLRHYQKNPVTPAPPTTRDN